MKLRSHSHFLLVLAVLVGVLGCQEERCPSDGSEADTEMGEGGVVFSRRTVSGTHVERTTVQWGTDRNESADGMVVAENGELRIVGSFDGFEEGERVGRLILGFVPGEFESWSCCDENESRGGASLGIDSDGNLLMTGIVFGVSARWTLEKWSSGGSKLWRVELGEQLRFPRFAVDHTGNSVVCGDYHECRSDGSCVWLKKLGEEGDLQWSHQGMGSVPRDGITVAAGRDGDVYVAGVAREALDGNRHAGHHDAFVRRLDPEGEPKWTIQWGTRFWDEITDVMVAEDGAAYVVGLTWGSFAPYSNAGESDVFLTKVSKDGKVEWTSQWGSEAYDRPVAVEVSDSGEIYVTGETRGAMVDHAKNRDSDVFLSKHTTAGEFEWLEQWGGYAAVYPTDLVVLESGRVVVVGTVHESLDGNTWNGHADAFYSIVTERGQ